MVDLFLTKIGRTKFDTVDGQNPAPPGMYKSLKNYGIFTISTAAGFQPSTVPPPRKFKLALVQFELACS